MEKAITCIECPRGCAINVFYEDNTVIDIKNNGCTSGKIYAENEIICPRRILTTTVKKNDGSVVPVKSDKPIKKDEIFNVMKKINSFVLNNNVVIGDVIIENITEDINIIATDNK